MKNKLIYFIFLVSFMLFPSVIMAQEITVTGKITDSKGATLPFVNIVIDGSVNGTQSDLNGNYSISATKGDILVFSFIGMETQKVVVESNTYNIVMKNNLKELEEVVVTGYSKQSTRNITGSVSVVNTKKLATTSPVNVEQSLQGQASGVLVGSEGGPGGSALVRIRGFGTVNNNDPLYLIDGTPTTTGINQLNPADIESIQILKDASSAAIYGFRAGNGVIIITTKSGKYANKTKLTFTGNVGVDYIAKSDFPKSLTPKELADVIWTRFKNDGVAPNHIQYGSGDTPVLPNYLTPAGANSVDESTYDPVTNKITKANKEGTNWFDEYFNPALVQDYNLNMSGGTETAKFNISLGVLQQDGVALETYFNRYSFRANSEFKVTDKIRIGESFNASYSKKVAETGSQFTGGDISFIYRADPILPIYDIAGNYAGTQSPGLGNGFNSVAAAKRKKDNARKNFRALGNLYLEADLFEGLTFKTNIGVDYNSIHGSFFTGLNPENQEANRVNRLREMTNYTLSSTWFNTLNYRKSFGEHRLGILLGTEFSETEYRFFDAQRADYYSENLDYRYLDAGTGTSSNSGRGDKGAYFSSFGKLDYSYADKYLVSLSLRRDASSKFASSKRVGVSPGYSFAWRISNEDFMKNLSFIDDLKIKAGYGELGNESIPQGRVPNLYENNLNTSNYSISGSNSTVSPGYNLFSLGNSDITWEITKTKNIGFDGILFNNKANFSFEYYQSKTSDMLLQKVADITLLGHAEAPYANIGSMENKGFDFSFGYNGNLTKEIQFNASINVSAYKNKVLNLEKDDQFLLGSAARETFPSRTQAGHALASFHGFIIDGIIQNEEELNNTANYSGKAIGTFKYRDVVEDGVIDDKDRTFIGSPHPDFTYAINLGLTYKRFDLSTMFQGSQGNDIYNFTKFFTDYNSFPGAKSYRYLNSWSPENPSGTLPKLTNSPAEHYSAASTDYIEDGSYLRLKNIQLGYNFSKEITSKIGVGSMRVYIQAKNLITWTKYSGLDPEINLQSYGGNNVNLDIGIDRGAYPVAKSLLIGVNVTL
jgi:TonB-linked SusC/RagA family outer membrane protein